MSPPVDILDLDIFDFDVEELADSKDRSSTIASNFHRIEDGQLR